MSSDTYDKRIQSSYSLGSTEKSAKEKSDKTVHKLIKDKSLAEIFTMKHPNLITVIMLLMQKRKMQVVAQQELLDPEDTYWNTGNFDPKKLGLVSLSPLAIVAVGRIQQVLVAGLQILFDVGPQSKSGSNFDVLYFAEDNTTNIRIMFKFNKQPVNLSIIGGDYENYMSLYIQD